MHLAAGLWKNNKDMRVDKSVEIEIQTLKNKIILKSLRYNNQLKKNKISKNWINRQRKDIYVRKSKIEGYRSRAVYKLEEINQKFKIFHSGASVLDLGAAPGSWSQYILNNYKNIKLASIDLKKFDEIKNAYQIEGDFTDDIYKKKL